MNKRGQFYIITALILSFALFGVTYASNTIEEPVLFSNFNEVSQNYVTESTKLINGLLEEQESDIPGRLQTFTSDFLNYAKLRDPSFGMVYVYSQDDTAIIKNEIDELIGESNESILGSEQDLVQDVSLEVGGMNFVHQVPITASNFGEEWNTGFGEGPFRLSIGGIIYPINPDNSFSVIIRSIEGKNTQIEIN